MSSATWCRRGRSRCFDEQDPDTRRAKWGWICTVRWLTSSEPHEIPVSGQYGVSTGQEGRLLGS